MQICGGVRIDGHYNLARSRVEGIELVGGAWVVKVVKVVVEVLLVLVLVLVPRVVLRVG